MPDNFCLKIIHRAACAFPPAINGYRRLREARKSDPLITAAYRKLFERNRLKLASISPEELSRAAGAVELPAHYPLFAGEDAPLNDMLFLMNLAKGRNARRILEIGTYRARTTYAFHLNCPEAAIVSYDIQVLDSEFRQRLKNTAAVELRHASFALSAGQLRAEPRYDLIFVDGSHRVEHVIEDSRLALELVAENGVIVWHDYRYNGYLTDALRVPEGLDVIAKDHKILAVNGTTCAVYVHSPNR